MERKIIGKKGPSGKQELFEREQSVLLELRVLPGIDFMTGNMINVFLS